MACLLITLRNIPEPQMPKGNLQPHPLSSCPRACGKDCGARAYDDYPRSDLLPSLSYIFGMKELSLILGSLAAKNGLLDHLLSLTLVSLWDCSTGGLYLSPPVYLPAFPIPHNSSPHSQKLTDFSLDLMDGKGGQLLTFKLHFITIIIVVLFLLHVLLIILLLLYIQ